MRREPAPDVARFGRGTNEIVRVPGARPASPVRGARARPSAGAVAVLVRQGRPPADCAAGSAHRRRHPRDRDLCRPLRVRRQGGDLRRPLAVRGAAAVRGLGGRRCSASAGCGTCAPPNSGITRANARALVDEWITLNSARDPLAWRPDVVARRVISWLSQAPLVLDESDMRFYRRFLRSLTRQVRHLRHTASRGARRRAALQAAIALTYAALCMAGQQRHIRAATKRLSEELRAPDPARRRPYQPQSRRADRAPGRPAAAAHRVHGAQHCAAAGAAQRHRPHDADAALLPPRRRQLRAVQRHGPDPDRPAHHHPGLRRRPRLAARQRAAFRLPAARERRHRGGDGHRPRRRRCR